MDWYSAIDYNECVPFEQGDIIYQCPHFITTRKGEECTTIIERFSVVILTQTCDMVNCKANKILVAPWLPLETLFSQDLAFKKARNPQKEKLNKDEKKTIFKHLKEGVRPRYHMLNKDEAKGLNDYPIIDFMNTYSIPIQELVIAAKEQGRIIRLNSPYKEHLSQSFARFFMRVGLPTTIENPFE